MKVMEMDIGTAKGRCGVEEEIRAAVYAVIDCMPTAPVVNEQERLLWAAVHNSLEDLARFFSVSGLEVFKH